MAHKKKSHMKKESPKEEKHEKHEKSSKKEVMASKDKKMMKGCK